MPRGNLEKIKEFSFSKENQPANRGRPRKTKEIRMLMNAFGRTKAPLDLLNDDFIKHFMVTRGLKGTFNEVLVAKLYGIALLNPSVERNLKAIEMILGFMKVSNPEGHGSGGIQINFITPPGVTQESPIDLTNDAWTVQDPVKESED